MMFFACVFMVAGVAVGIINVVALCEVDNEKTPKAGPLGILFASLMFTCGATFIWSDISLHGYPAYINYISTNSVVEVISCQPDPNGHGYLTIIKMPNNNPRLLMTDVEIAPGLGKVIYKDEVKVLVPFPEKPPVPEPAKQ